jgi:rhodanese-related sulfurtransferase
MIRKKLKDKARKAAIKLLKMEFDAEHRDPAGRGVADPSAFDPDKIPKVVDGAGDTPGPNHKTEIGRPWVAAQLVGGVAPVFVDVRPAPELAQGLLPAALAMPGKRIQAHLDQLPPKNIRVTVYDQTGEQGAVQTAAWLREQGWTLARSLRGGFVEWIEHGEPVEAAAATEDGKTRVGDPTTLADGRAGWAIEVNGSDITVWLSTDEEIGPVQRDALSS